MSSKTGKAGWLVLTIMALAACACAGATVVVNEIAWGGTAASSSDEWIELHNPTDEAIDLDGWVLTFGDAVVPLGAVGDDTVAVRGTILPPGGYWLLERTDDATVSDVEADVVYKGALSNDGTVLELRDPTGRLVDRIAPVDDGWIAGTASGGVPAFATMERVDPTGEVAAWATNDGRIRNGTDADGGLVNGTPRQENSATAAAKHAPRVQLTAPIEEGAILSGTVLIGWVASDPDGAAESLRISLELSLDAGETWETLAVNLANGGSYAWDTTAHPDSTSIRVRVTAEDGSGYVATAEGPTVTIRNAAN